MPFIDDPDFTLYVGDVRETVAQMPSQSVDCVVTSPPYWGLRDYGTGEWEGGDQSCSHQVRESQSAGSSTLSGGKGSTGHAHEGFRGECGRCGAVRIDRQIGLEETPGAYIEELVSLFREIRRVLSDHGTVWLNLGDSYANQPAGNSPERPSGFSQKEGRREGGTVDLPQRDLKLAGLKQKDLVGVPWRVALALQEDGWYLRSDIIWAKPNPMPESVTDRPTKSHEYIFLLSKRASYFFDQEAVREPHGGRGSGIAVRNPNPVSALGQGDTAHSIPWEPEREVDPAVLTLGDLPGEPPRGADGRRKTTHDHLIETSHENHSNILGSERWPNSGRNIRSVWEIATVPYAEAHFATYPLELARRCILAGCPEQVCTKCGKPRERVVSRIATGFDGSRYGARAVAATGGARDGGTAASTLGSSNGSMTAAFETLGWSDCGCAYGLAPDALELIATPVGGERPGDPSLQVGRGGLSRPRADDEGVRMITRFEQRAYAQQLRDSPHRQQMEQDAGTAFEHYIRKDRAGARPIPGDLLDRWIVQGWLERVSLPERVGGTYRLGVVFDPFMGSGTTALVAREQGRHAVGCELNPEYAELCASRTKQLSLLA